MGYSIDGQCKDCRWWSGCPGTDEGTGACKMMAGTRNEDKPKFEGSLAFAALSDTTKEDTHPIVFTSRFFACLMFERSLRDTK